MIYCMLTYLMRDLTLNTIRLRFAGSHHSPQPSIYFYENDNPIKWLPINVWRMYVKVRHRHTCTATTRCIYIIIILVNIFIQHFFIVGLRTRCNWISFHVLILLYYDRISYEWEKNTVFFSLNKLLLFMIICYIATTS